VTTKLHIKLYDHDNLTVILHKAIIGYLLNELGNEMDIHLKAYKVKSILSVHAQMVFTFLGCLAKVKILYI
jgi:hypothetical protein